RGGRHAYDSGGGGEASGVAVGAGVADAPFVGRTRLGAERSEQPGEPTGVVPGRNDYGHPPVGSVRRGGGQSGYTPEQHPPDDPGDREEQPLEQRSHASSSTPPARWMSG